jgi:methionyl-tRNA formyltransferase
MKVVLLLAEDNIGSNISLARLQRYKEVEIVGIIRSPFIRGGVNSNNTYFQRMGFILTMGLGIQLAFVRFFSWIYGKDLDRLTRNHDVKITDNVNSKESVEFIRAKQPDFIVSTFFNQILKPEVLSIPKIEAVNIHPADINRYRGSVNYFWVVHNQEQQTAITLHRMDEGVDTGSIIAIRPFKIRPHDNHFTVHVKSAFIGTKMLRRYLRGQLKPSEIRPRKGSYYSFPDRSSILRYLQRKPVFHFWQIAAIMRKLV